MEICTFLTQGRYDREIVQDDLGLYYVYSISILCQFGRGAQLYVIYAYVSIYSDGIMFYGTCCMKA